MRTVEEIQAGAEGRPAFSNRTEYDIWADRYCYECVHDDGEVEKWCPILTVALLGSWPAEWTRSSEPYEHVDTCTEFEQRRDEGDDPGVPEPEPPPDCSGQVDIFEVYADLIVEHLSGLEPVEARRG